MNVVKIAWRNLLRYKRRTLLTASLIALGVLLVVVFGGVGNAFKNQVIESITNTSLGDIEIHHKGYVASIDNLPLNITIPGQALPKVESILKSNPNVAAYSERLRFGSMISNYEQTTNMSLIAVDPKEEAATVPGILANVTSGSSSPDSFVKPGWILIPENIAAGLGLKVGSDVVVVATNKDGSVNGLNLRVSAITANVLGPQARFGYIDMKDAQTLLRINDGEINEIAIRLKDFGALQTTYAQLKASLSQLVGPLPGMMPGTGPGAIAGSPAVGGRASASSQAAQMGGGADNPAAAGSSIFEIHTWRQLSPFANIAAIVTILIYVIRVVLIFIVLVSILNVMVMSVYERIGEIGTIASIGTLPSKILSLFLTEGLALGLSSGIAGSILGVAIIGIINALKVHFTFGKMSLTLAPHVPTADLVIAIVVVIVVSALASLQPAVKAARMEPVEALRHV